MKLFFLLILFLLNLDANDQTVSNKTNSKNIKTTKPIKSISNDINTLTIIEFQKQYTTLNNRVADFETNLEKTKKDVINLTYMLEMEKRYNETLLKNQNTRFNDLLETERWIFGLIGGFFLIIFAIVSFFGNKFINKKINKLTKKEYQDNLIRNIKNSFIEDEELQRAVINEMIKNEEFKTKIKVLVKDSNDIVSEKAEKPEGFKGLQD